MASRKRSPQLEIVKGTGDSGLHCTFTGEAQDAFKDRVRRFEQDLEQQVVTIADSQGAERVLRTHVEAAAPTPITKANKGKIYVLGTVGGALTGATASPIVSAFLDPPSDSMPLSILALFSMGILMLGMSVGLYIRNI